MHQASRLLVSQPITTSHPISIVIKCLFGFVRLSFFHLFAYFDRHISDHISFSIQLLLRPESDNSAQLSQVYVASYYSVYFPVIFISFKSMIHMIKYLPD
jgi:hypothetical protein